MSERREVIERLRAVRLTHNMHPNPMSRLVAIARAVMPKPGWPTIAWCHDFRDRLIELLDDADAEVDAVRHECEEQIARMVDDIDAVRHEYSNQIVEILERAEE